MKTTYAEWSRSQRRAKWVTYRVSRNADPAVGGFVAYAGNASAIGATEFDAVAGLLEYLGTDCLSVDRGGRKLCLRNRYKYFG